MLDIRPMFAIPLAVTSIGREITKEEFDFIECQSIRNNVGNRISTDAQILKNDPLKNIREFIMVNVYDYFKQVYDPIDNFIPYITLSWANYAKKGEFHPPHNHSNSLVSGVFYIRATENDTFGILRDVRDPAILISPAEPPPIWSSRSVQFRVTSGDLLLFPSHLYHYVPTIEHDNGVRISIAFNIFVKGIVGNKNLLNELIL